MANVPVTGLSALGAVLADAGQTYARNTRQDQLLAQQRGQQLEDVQSQRAYSEKVRKDDRSTRLEDEATMAIIRQGMAMKQAFINEGLLSPADANNPEAVKVAWEEAQRRGLDKLYQELLSTPGPDGRPLLTQDQLTDAQAVAVAKDALGQLKAKQLQFGMDQRDNAQATIDQMSGELTKIRGQKDAIAKSISQPAPQYGPTAPEVLQLASQMAEQAKPGSGRNREAIAAMAPMAQKQLNEQSLMAHAQSVQAARAELDSLRYSEAQLTGSLERAMGTFKVAPRASATPTALQPTTSAAPAPKAANASDVAAAVNQLLGGGSPAGAPAAGTGSALLENPTDNPTIAAGNAELQRRAAGEATAALNAAIRDGEVIERELQAASGPTRGVGLAPGITGGMSAVLYDDPIGGAQKTSALLKKKAANDARIQQLRAQAQGALPASATPPALNTPTTSTPMAPSSPPMWWKTGQPAPASLQ